MSSPFSYVICAQAQIDSVIQNFDIFFSLDFIPKTVSAESEVNVETPEDSITTEKLKAGVHSYLKQNAEKVS